MEDRIKDTGWYPRKQRKKIILDQKQKEKQDRNQYGNEFQAVFIFHQSISI